MSQDNHFLGIRFSKERLAWYLYDGGTSVVALLAMVMFVPVYLLSTAEYAAWGPSLLEDCASNGSSYPCRECIPDKGWFAKVSADSRSILEERSVNVLGFSITSGAFPTVVVTVSTVLQAIMYITVGGLADRGSSRKLGLIVASVIGQMAMLGFFLPLAPDSYMIAAALVIIANCANGVSFVYYNAYLPLLVDADERVLVAPDVEKASVREFFQNRMSSYGFAAAYASSLILAIGGVVIQVVTGGSSSSDGFFVDRLCIAMHGIWWLILSVPAYFWLKTRPGLPFEGSTLSICFSGWVEAYRVLKEATRYPQTFIFLLCYFFYSDTISTIALVGVLFAKEVLCMRNDEMALVLVEILVFAMVGNIVYLKIYKRWSLEPKTLITWILCVYSGLCLWGCLGYFNFSPIGFKSKWELHLFAAIHGLHTGSLQSFSRTLFADLIPPGKEGQFFSLYQITDKGGSWLGPLAITIIKQTTHSLRPGFFFLFLLTTGSTVLFSSLLDHRKGIQDAGRADKS